ncbi:hypothetical protein NN6n1_13250 [Shinella zoogloeoides]
MIVRDIRVALKVGEIIGVEFSPPFTCLGIEKDGEIIGGAVFNVFEANDCHVSVAGTGFNRSFLAEVGHYVFTVLGKGRITVITEQPRIVRIAERLGGKVEGLMRSHFGRSRDAYLVGILKEDYPW